MALTNDGNKLAVLGYALLSTALLLALLAQMFLAGMAIGANANWWLTHKAWVGMFQWLAVPLPFLAWRTSRRGRAAALAAVPMVLVGAQYVLAHRGMDGRWSYGIGLHVADAGLLLLIAWELTRRAWARLSIANGSEV